MLLLYFFARFVRNDEERGCVMWGKGGMIEEIEKMWQIERGRDVFSFNTILSWKSHLKPVGNVKTAYCALCYHAFHSGLCSMLDFSLNTLRHWVMSKPSREDTLHKRERNYVGMSY